jgi:biotin synthase
MLKNIFNKIDTNEELTSSDLKFLLEIDDKSDLQKLFDKAYEIKEANIGKKVWFRGIIEFSNICQKTATIVEYVKVIKLLNAL